MCPPPTPVDFPPWTTRRPRLRVLLVEDDHDTADTLAVLLRMDRHDVFIAYDGLSAVDTGKQFPPDVMLLDLELPLLDGWQVAEALFAVPPKDSKKSLVIAISGRGSDLDRQRSAQVGIAILAPKPVGPEMLLALLRRHRSVIN